MATSIPDPPAFIQACSALSDKLKRMPVSISAAPNRAEELVEETASAHGARILVTGAAADAPSEGRSMQDNCRGVCDFSASREFSRNR